MNSVHMSVPVLNNQLIAAILAIQLILAISCAGNRFLGPGPGPVLCGGPVELVLEAHAVDGGQAEAGPEDVLDARALLEERVDDGRALRDEGRLAEVAEHREDRVEVLVGAAGNAAKAEGSLGPGKESLLSR